MKLKFNSTLQHQQDAINAVVSLFDGQPKMDANFAVIHREINELVPESGIANKLIISDEQLLENVHKIQVANDIEKVKDKKLQRRDFSIEMETGTGKTYVYLRTIFELSKHYGLKKFIIVVPSVAIREGVIQSIKAMREHFSALYDNEPFSYFFYDSKKLNTVHQFSTNNQIQIMIINIQSFQRDVETRELSELTPEELKKLNVINRENDRMSGRKPIEFIKDTNPIVIIDEPQSVDNTAKAQKAIKNLNPLITLRYSATHRNYYNLLYKLDPVRAYELRLVKHIEVNSVRSDNFNDSYVRLLTTDNKKGIKARIEIYQKIGNAVKTRKLWVKQGDNLYRESNEHGQYRDGYIVKNINCRPGNEYVEFNSGKYVEFGQAIGENGDDVMKAQIYDTVMQHLDKERFLRNREIKVKVLSLFFIDKVANYRVYNENGTPSLGKIGKWFEEAYQHFTERPRHEEFVVEDIGKIHDGYFSQDRKKKQYKDSTERGNADDNDTYEKIMRDKELLLDPKEPLRFIFSHSALREGWDNPNVFQICTLNESATEMKKRQEIGRGLRLPVNARGERIYDENINRLTVIVNESYQNFVNSLQRELEEDSGVKFGRIEKIAFSEITRTQADGTKKMIGREQSKRIWEALRESGYIDNDGRMLLAKEIKSPLDIDEEFRDIEDAIIEIIERHRGKIPISNARERTKIQLNKEVLLTPEFKALWDKIKYKTRYRIRFGTDKLVDCAVKRIEALETIERPKITSKSVDVKITQEEMVAKETGLKHYDASPVVKLPDILAYLQKETELTRDTLVKILKNSDRLKEFITNPQLFMMLVAREINHALSGLMIKGIRYEKIDGHYWEMRRIEKEAEAGIIRYLNNLYMVKDEKKCPFNAIAHESEVERQFARDLDNHREIRMFLKLPSWFKIDTPIGTYNPDWAFVSEYDEKLYFVCETKGSLDSEDLRQKEEQKITCGKSHFKEIGVEYKMATKLTDINLQQKNIAKNDNS